MDKPQWERSLADDIVEMDEHAAERFGLRVVQDALRLPWDHLLGPERQNHVSPPHPAIADILAKECRTTAQARFRVEPAMADFMSTIISDETTLDIAKRLALIPSATGWVEWRRARTGDSRCGVLWRKRPDGPYLGFCVWQDGKGTTVCGGVLQFDEKFDGGFRSHKEFDPPLEFGVAYQRFLICFFATVTQPHSAHTQWTVPSERLQKKQRRRGKWPLLSFNTVDFAKGASSDGDERKPLDAPGVRWHHVMAHWRSIIGADGKPRLVAVKPHWRGDPRLGIVGKQHLVSQRSGLASHV